jgi:hypothetical protein
MLDPSSAAAAGGRKLHHAGKSERGEGEKDKNAQWKHYNWFATSLRGWLHERFRVRFHVKFAASAILCPTRIPFNIFLHQIADAIGGCAIPCPFCSCSEIVHAPNRTANRTQNIMLRVIGSNSVSDTKLQMQQITSAICSKSHMKSHTCNQPLSDEPCLYELRDNVSQSHLFNNKLEL